MCLYSGAFEVLETAGILKNIKRIAGTSGGAIAGTLLAIGCTPTEVAERFTPCWEDFKDSKFGWASYPYNLFNILGFNPGHRAYNVIAKNIEEKTGNAEYTFRQLFDERGIELCIVTTNVSAMAIQYFHPKTTPNVPIAEAVRMSMSIPIMMAPFRKSSYKGDSVYVDGGLLCNYPVHAFDGWFLSMDSNDSFFRKLRKGRERWFGDYNNKTLGICVYQTGELDTMKTRVHQVCQHGMKRPNTELAKKRGVESDKMLEKLRWKSMMIHAIDLILTTVHDYDKDHNGKMSKAEMTELLKDQDDELKAAHQLVYGDEYDPQKFLDSMKDDDELSFENFVDYLEMKIGIGLEDLTESVDSASIDTLSDYFGAIMNTWQMASAGKYNNEYDAQRTIGVYTDYVGTMDLDMATPDLEFLKRQARVATVNYLLQWTANQSHMTSGPTPPTGGVVAGSTVPGRRNPRLIRMSTCEDCAFFEGGEHNHGDGSEYGHGLAAWVADEGARFRLGSS